MNPDDSLDADDLTAWASALRRGRPDAVEEQSRKVLAQVESLTRAMFRRFPQAGRFADVDDVVQNCFIRLLTALRRVIPESSGHFHALANTLIRRELLTLLGRHGGERSPVPLGEEVDPPTPDQTADLDWSASFHEALSGLPPEERESVGLVYYHGWTQVRIAELFGVSVRTVQRWQDSAATTLRQKLAG